MNRPRRPLHAPRGRLLLALGPLLAAAALLSGCSETRRSIHVRIDGALQIPAEADRIEVWFVASRTDEGNLCGAWRRRFELLRPEDLPVSITFQTDGVYDAWAAFLVVVSRQGEEMYRYRNRTTWPTEGRLEVAVTIDLACYGMDCGPDMQCFAGECHDLPFVEDYFGDHSLWDPGVPCEAQAELQDVTEQDGD
ncbi:MAG: hypothetical protein JXB32_24600 [Deltaproteobacteria bacterium]|nr:hypothetical protein [Deltaproteobacteria bacterium]